MHTPGWIVGGGLALVLAGTAVLAGPGMVSGQAGTSLSISPPSQNIAAGSGEITIEVKASNVTNLGAYDFVLEFNPDVLEYVGSSDFGFLASTGRSQTCFGFGQGAATVNGYGALRAGCGTNGLIENGQGKSGPGGSGVLAQVVFKPKGIGTSNLVFKGLGTDKYYLGAENPSVQPEDPTQPPPGTVEVGQTGLESVEVCPGNGLQCLEQEIEFAPGAGVVAVINPNAATPTALPPTPTPEPPSDVDQEDFQATVAAAVGTPRVLGTAPAGTVPGSSGGAGTAGGGSASGAGTTGGGSTAAGELPEGVTIGADGIPRGPDGAPIAGYGPQDEGRNPLWVWGGVALLIWGAIVMGCGAYVRLSAQRDTSR